MLIAHDLGTTGDKASLHDAEGRLQRSVTITYPTHLADGGVAEQDPELWWEAVCTATRRLLDESGAAAGDIAGLGFSGQMMGAVLLDEDFEPVRPALIWADTRSQDQCRRLVDAVGEDAGYELTGHRLNPTYSLSKVMWVRDHEPGVFGRTRFVCLAKDFIVYRLTGRLVTDPSDASSTNAYDQRGGRWSTELLAAAGLPEALWPEIVPSTTVVGGISAAAADRVGLLTGTPVVIGGGDGPMAAVGAGITSPADGSYVYLGSSSWVSMAAAEPLLDPAHRTMTFDHVIPGLFVPTATMVAGGGSLQWVTSLLAGDDPDRFERLLAEAAEARAADEGLYFLPHLLGERSPYWNPDARGVVLGLAQHHGRGAVVRAVLEGVAFNLATCVEAFRSGGALIDRVDAIGGGAASDLWLQVLADTWNVEVRRRSIVEEANSLGAAVTAGVGVGLIPDFSVAGSLSETTAVFTPDPARHARLVEQHSSFLDAYRCLEPWFRQEARR